MDDIEKMPEVEKKPKFMAIARISCRKCFGRGYIGTDQEGNKVKCRCVKIMPIKEST